MRWVANKIMERRARDLFLRLARHLPSGGRIADVGSGTGHNAEQIRRHTALTVNEFDIADLHWVGPGPTLISVNSLPADDDSFTSLMMLFVLQYPESVAQLLFEARRVTIGSVIVLQSTYRGALGLFVLRFREFFWGRMAFYLAVMMKLIDEEDCPLRPRRYFTRRELLEEFSRAGFVVRVIHRANWTGLNVSRDLFVLDAIEP